MRKLMCFHFFLIRCMLACVCVRHIISNNFEISLSFYRLRFLGIEMYKCVNGFNPTYLNDLFTAQSNDCHFRDSIRLIQPKFNTFRFGSKSFRYFGAKLWNVLPDIKRHGVHAKDMFRSVHFRMLSLHSLMNVADRHFRPFCSFIMYYFFILFVCL